jgi:hypothetical protein
MNSNNKHGHAGGIDSRFRLFTAAEAIPSSSDQDDSGTSIEHASPPVGPRISIISSLTSEYSGSPGNNTDGDFFSSSCHYSSGSEQASLSGDVNVDSGNIRHVARRRRVSDQREYQYYGALAHGAGKDELLSHSVTVGDEAKPRPSVVSMEVPAVPHEVR